MVTVTDIITVKVNLTGIGTGTDTVTVKGLNLHYIEKMVSIKKQIYIIGKINNNKIIILAVSCENLFPSPVDIPQV